MDERRRETKRLRRNVEWTLRRALDPTTVLPMLHRLSRLAPPGTDEEAYAHRRLAEILVEQHPWRAALSARRVVALRQSDDGAWALLALAYALLGYPRCAVGAYRRALDLAPSNAAYAHNLGHLVDVALDRPAEAVPWLRRAYERSERRADVGVSFAHALGRTGALREAKAVTDRALLEPDGQGSRELVALARWLGEGAPETQRLVPGRPPAALAPAAWTASGHVDDGAEGADTRTLDALDSTLSRGMARLPLDAGQRARAHALAREPAVTRALPLADGTMASVAAAVAFAVIHTDGVPLTQAEVAACFRVSVPALRGRLKTLRPHLGDALAHGRAAAERPR